ncbi:MAG: hypothetical protein RMK29_09995 [Myxococcales bacterium]|nr:hypothetical protein [Myxococcota bacterium]MDW8282034.1 hypothetical protein [Myxococcales bacterium]
MRALIVLLLVGSCSRLPLPLEDPAKEREMRPDQLDLGGGTTDLRPPTGGRPEDVVVVMASRMRGFYTSVNNTGTLAFEAGPGAPPLALGALRMRTGSGDGPNLGGRAVLSTGLLSRRLLRDLDALAYSTYVRPTSMAATHLAPGLSLHLDLDGDGVRDTTLVFEPANAPQQGSVRRGAWQNWDVLQGRFYFTQATGAFCAMACLASLAEVLAAHPLATIVDAETEPGTALWAGQRTGSSWAGFDGAVDALVVSVRGRRVHYDLEPEAETCQGTGYTTSQRPIFWNVTDCENYHQ